MLADGEDLEERKARMDGFRRVASRKTCSCGEGQKEA